jgi:hypothetical protein
MSERFKKSMTFFEVFYEGKWIYARTKREVEVRVLS